MAATQAALYGALADDLYLSWSESELPERERTKHVHRLHPNLGKFAPQLVEALLLRYVRPGGRVLDPFAGSGTTLVQCLESGYEAVGVDVAAFNCLLMHVKTASYDPFRLESELREAQGRLGRSRARPRGYVADWFARDAAAELLHFRALVEGYEHGDVLRVVLARAARSARLTTHFDSTSRVRRSAGRTGATSTSACAFRSSARRSFSPATSSTPSSGSTRSAGCGHAGSSPRSSTAMRPRSSSRSRSTRS